MNFCKDCQFFDRRGSNPELACKAPDAGVIIDVVRGTMSYHRAHDMRAFGCGTHAKWFVPATKGWFKW